jgi:acyl-[acyl-carrier-protein]-phospholipid O-acyltransferase/long-chain-fatty-acid--[acyl-carrier-protein] ligase
MGAGLVRSDCRSRSYRALLVAQFFGALNDNLFKLFVTLLVVRNVLAADEGITHLVLINICFIAPYILFSTLAGSLADKLAKTSILRAAKVMELAVMAAGAYFLETESTYILLVILFFMGAHSAIFSPSKYGILPELLEDTSLSKGNGYLEFVTFVGIIAGTALAGLVLTQFSFSSGVPGILLVVISAIGLIGAYAITPSKAIAPQTSLQWNPLNMLFATLAMRKNKGLFLSIIAISYFWSIGALYQLNVVLFGTIEGGLGDLAVSLQLAALGVGIGCGSIAAGKVSEGKVELGLVPIGALGLAFWSIALAFFPQQPILAGLILIGVGFFAGFYIVPLNSFLQENSPAETRGVCLAACNFVSFSGMLLFSLLLLGGIDYAGLKPSGIFLFSGASAVLIAIYICTVLPEVFLRCINWILMHLVYRIEIRGEENIPHDRGALLVCNHVSMIDACLLLASCQRPVRFLMFKPYYENKFIRPFAKVMGSIPIESGGSDTENALLGATKAIDQGELVGIFAEGAITRTGHMLRFRSGLERIMQGVDAPIVPVHLDQIWGSVFSFRGGKFFWKWPRKLPYPVRVSFGTPLPATASAVQVRLAVQELSAAAFAERKEAQGTLGSTFIRVAKCRRLSTAILSPSGRWSYYRLLVDARCISKLLASRTDPSEAIAIAGSLSGESAGLHLACALLGRSVVPIDQFVSPQSLETVKAEMRLETLVYVGADLPMYESFVKRISYQSLLAEVSLVSRVLTYAAVSLVPVRFLTHLYSAKIDPEIDTAAVVFSRGSSGKQKAVCLSHKNIVSNCIGFQELFSCHDTDVVTGEVPLSHSTGLSGLLWLPLLCGSVLNVAKDPKALLPIRFLFVTTTQLAEIISDERRELLKRVAIVVVGGEPLDDTLRSSVEEFTDAEVLEAYGSAELAPLALINVPNFIDAKGGQVGRKVGSLGHPLPGIAVRVVDPSSQEPVGLGQKGELWVKGANVMRGYLGAESAVLVDGWYRTGDLVELDIDGFVRFRGRLSQYA